MFIDSPKNIFEGVLKVINSPDVLVTDYIYIGGLGAAITNSAIVGFISILLMKVFKCENRGTNIMAIWLMMGFAFFGKNLLNTFPIILGGYVYSLYHKKPFSNYMATTMLSTSLAPVVSQMMFLGLHPAIGLLLSIIVGVALGYAIIPISSYTYRAHGGYNLYNVGFAAGIVSLVLAALLRNAGFTVEPVSLWSEGKNTVLTVFLMSTSLILIAGGIILTANEELFKIKSYKAHFPVIDDTYTTHGEKAYLNMGILGIFSTALILFVDGELSGPIIGGIFTIIGFGCVGKTLYNIFPAMLGCLIATFFAGWEFNNPSIMLTMLFSATLAPISSNFHSLWGVLAGFIHLNISVKLSAMNGGLSLYNNGLAGGFVAIIIVPIIFSLQRKPNHHNSHLNYDSHV
ncbi:DUF1576 domain-containing protein [Anaeropeptidivorans aminofermentans]|uniref:DUF1576 domain-containing protein n=1 Tax=Anaeropeptidivorans aminofermentans TaxID=2934315 RepID=UPI002024E621|nr:DUF1576 domain-containing protein [Anaeropeptidivorans aminofermentans]